MSEIKRHVLPRAKPWLQGTSRRTLQDIEPIVYRQIERRIYNMIYEEHWPYKVRIPFYVARDRALMALLFLTMGRIHEVLKLTKSQFDLVSNPKFVIIQNYEVGKRKKATIRRFGRTYIDIPISKKSIFMKTITDYLEVSDEKLFKFGRYRAWQIIKHVTGLWCHWFRAQAQSFYVNKLGNPAVVSDMFKVKIETIMFYFRGLWMDHQDKLE